MVKPRSFCSPSFKQRVKKRITTLKEITSNAKWERIFTSRKRTLMQKANELEISTGCWVTVTVRSPLGGVWFYATSDSLHKSLHNSEIVDDKSVRVTGESMNNNILLVQNSVLDPDLVSAVRDSKHPPPEKENNCADAQSLDSQIGSCPAVPMRCTRPTEDNQPDESKSPLTDGTKTSNTTKTTYNAKRTQSTKSVPVKKTTAKKNVSLKPATKSVKTKAKAVPKGRDRTLELSIGLSQAQCNSKSRTQKSDTSSVSAKTAANKMSKNGKTVNEVTEEIIKLLRENKSENSKKSRDIPKNSNPLGNIKAVPCRKDTKKVIISAAAKTKKMNAVQRSNQNKLSTGVGKKSSTLFKRARHIFFTNNDLDSEIQATSAQKDVPNYIAKAKPTLSARSFFNLSESSSTTDSSDSDSDSSDDDGTSSSTSSSEDEECPPKSSCSEQAKKVASDNISSPTSEKTQLVHPLQTQTTITVVGQGNEGSKERTSPRSIDDNNNIIKSKPVVHSNPSPSTSNPAKAKIFIKSENVHSPTSAFAPEQKRPRFTSESSEQWRIPPPKSRHEPISVGDPPTLPKVELENNMYEFLPPSDNRRKRTHSVSSDRTDFVSNNRDFREGEKRRPHNAPFNPSHEYDRYQEHGRYFPPQPRSQHFAYQGIPKNYVRDWSSSHQWRQQTPRFVNKSPRRGVSPGYAHHNIAHRDSSFRIPSPNLPRSTQQRFPSFHIHSHRKDGFHPRNDHRPFERTVMSQQQQRSFPFSKIENFKRKDRRRGNKHSFTSPQSSYGHHLPRKRVACVKPFPR